MRFTGISCAGAAVCGGRVRPKHACMQDAPRTCVDATTLCARQGDEYVAVISHTSASQLASAVARTTGAVVPSYTTSHDPAPCVTCSASVSPFGGGNRAALVVPSSYLHSPSQCELHSLGSSTPTARKHNIVQNNLLDAREHPAYMPSQCAEGSAWLWVW